MGTAELCPTRPEREAQEIALAEMLAQAGCCEIATEVNQ